MSLIKLAVQQQNEKGVAGWTKRHPLIASGIALTGGIAAADAGLNLFKHLKGGGSLRTAGNTVKHGLEEGAIYGGILSAVEPTILHGGLRKKVGKE